MLFALDLDDPNEVHATEVPKTSSSQFPFSLDQWLYARTIIASRNMQVPVEKMAHVSTEASTTRLQEGESVVELSNDGALDYSLEAIAEDGDESTAGGGSEAAGAAVVVTKPKKAKKKSKRKQKGGRGKEGAAPQRGAAAATHKVSNQPEADTIPIVVPLADLANHSNEPNASWRINEREKCFEMVVISDVVSFCFF